MRTDLKPKAIELRKSGYLYSEIARELGVAKSTVHSWTSDTTLDVSQANRVSLRLKHIQQEKIKNLAIINRQRRNERDLLIKEVAEDFINTTKPTTDIKKLLCAVMFWCEGGKDVVSGVRFINSDPLMVKTFLSLLRDSFPLNEERFRALIHLHEYHEPDKQLQFWSEVTGIPEAQFHKPYLKSNTGSNIRDGYPGCVSIRYSDSSLGKLLKMLYIEFGNSM